MHEIKTIYRNWGNIPQNVLPLPMLPVGRTPGEKTLILLARLSKVEPQPEKANALLQQNIHNRNAQNLSGAQIHAITNKDIKRALAHLKKPTYASEANSRDAMLECFSPKESEKVEGSDVRANPVNTDPGQPSAEYSELVLEDGQPGDQTFSSRLYPTDITQAFSESTSSHSRVDQGLDFRSPAGYRNQPSALRHRHTHSPSASSQSQSYKPSTPSRESSLSESDISLMPTGAERISRAFDSYYPSIVEELKCSSKTGLDNNTFNPFKNTPQALSVRESSFRTSKILSRQPPILSGPPSKRKAGADSHLGISGSGKGGKNKSSDLGSVAVSIICSSGSPTPVKEPWENEDLYNASPRTPTRNPGGNSIHSAKTLPSPALLDYPAVKRRKTGEI